MKKDWLIPIGIIGVAVAVKLWRRREISRVEKEEGITRVTIIKTAVC